MGRPKLLLSWGVTSILGQVIGQWKQAGQIAVVCRADDDPIKAELERLSFPAQNRIINPEADRGMFSSIQCAARWSGWNRARTHFVITLGDQPHLRTESLTTLMQFARQHPRQACQPSFNGKRAHPVILPRQLFLKLSATRAATLKEFLQETEMTGCEIEDPGLELDIDRPKDYARALALAGL